MSDEPENPWREMRAGERVQDGDEHGTYYTDAKQWEWLPCMVTVGLILDASNCVHYRTRRP